MNADGVASEGPPGYPVLRTESNGIGKLLPKSLSARRRKKLSIAVDGGGGDDTRAAGAQPVASPPRATATRTMTRKCSRQTSWLCRPALLPPRPRSSMLLVLSSTELAEATVEAGGGRSGWVSSASEAPDAYRSTLLGRRASACIA